MRSFENRDLLFCHLLEIYFIMYLLFYDRESDRNCSAIIFIIVSIRKKFRKMRTLHLAHADLRCSRRPISNIGTRIAMTPRWTIRIYIYFIFIFRIGMVHAFPPNSNFDSISHESDRFFRLES